MRVNLIVQSEATECGLASLAMIAGAHGMQVSLAEMRRRFPLSLKGAKLSQLIHISHQLGFSSRALRVDMGELHQLKLPCVLHWDMNHFVVLTNVTASKASVMDPASGERVMSMSELSVHFTGVALELGPTTEFKVQSAPSRVTMQQLSGQIVGLRRALVPILLLSVALQVFVIVAPFFLQWTVDEVLVSADRDLLAVLGLGFALLLILQAGVGLLRGWSVVHLSSQLGVQWMGNIFAHLIRLPMDYFEKRHLGDITSRLGSVQAIQKTLTTSFVEAVIDGLMAVVTFGLMLFYSAKLAFISVVAMFCYLAIRAIAYRSVRTSSERQLIASARQQSHLLESLRGMLSIKVAGTESKRRAAYCNLMVDSVNQDVRLARLTLSFTVASQVLFGIERIAVIWLGASLALESVFSVGMLIAYLAYRDLFSQRVGSLIDKWIEFRMLRLHGERLADIALSEPEVQHSALELPADSEAGIEVTGLSFRYADGEPYVVQGCTFSVAPGECVAIIGASGCGKTTLVKLMLGLLKPTEGSIRVGGADLYACGPQGVRSLVGAVMQDDQLFAGSIADNICFFESTHDQERIEVAARLAAIHEEIVAMPMSYQSLIGDMGSSLSGGQKQRVILARALYRQPSILFLDEATSHLDVIRERSVSAAVKGLNLTRIIVAHRPETIATADRVLVMEHGRISQQINPAELVSRSAA